MNDIALYIHYPFCRSKCRYCGFASSVEDKSISENYRRKLNDELDLHFASPQGENTNLTSIYFGGGTPSLMPVDYPANFLEYLSKICSVSKNAEITIEVNPNPEDYYKYHVFRKSGINRLSIGAQSFHPEELEFLGRTHTPRDILNAVIAGRKAGFDNISLDLIYGVPGQSVETFIQSVQSALDSGVDHLSTYTLSVENDTPLNKLIDAGKIAKPDSELMADQYSQLIALMRDRGFEHYELTNYAKPGKWSRHNFTCWQRKPYLGIGVGAHSFDGHARSWNTRSTARYIDRVKSGELPVEGREELFPENELAERVYLSLRTRDGISSEVARELKNPEIIEQFIKGEFLYFENDRLHISEKHWLLLDEIALRLMS